MKKKTVNKKTSKHKTMLIRVPAQMHSDFQTVCKRKDMAMSQVIRRLISDYVHNT